MKTKTQKAFNLSEVVRVKLTDLGRMEFEMACVESVIENEIKQGLNQKQIAQSYALGLRSSWPTDWAKVNKMIIDRWSMTGLERIKKMAWSGSCFPAQVESKPTAAATP